MHQRITIIGNLGGDPEGRYTPGGKAVTSFNVATEYSYVKDGERIKEPTWFKVTVWGKNAENCNEYLSKGKRVMVEGRIKLNVWLDKASGEPRGSLELNADKVLFLSPREDRDSTPYDSEGDFDPA